MQGDTSKVLQALERMAVASQVTFTNARFPDAA
jgi:hypothetical protein